MSMERTYIRMIKIEGSFTFRADGVGHWRFHEPQFEAKDWLCYNQSNESEFMEGSQMMELIYKNIALGKIVVTNRETFWVSGEFYPYPSVSEFKDFLDALVCEDGFDEARFDEDLLKEDHWFVSENGSSKGISCPAVYENYEIAFRYR